MTVEKRLPYGPVAVVHLEDPPGSGLAACCGVPFDTYEGRSPSWLCTGCANSGNRKYDRREAVETFAAKVRAGVVARAFAGGGPGDLSAIGLREAVRIIDEAMTDGD